MIWYIAKGKGPEGTARVHVTAAAEAEEVLKASLLPPEPAVVPSQSIYMQAVEFLLDAKATPVRFQHNSLWWGVVGRVALW